MTTRETDTHTGPVIDRSIYAMPMFASLIVRDLAAAEQLYAAAGFVTLASIPDHEGAPAVLHLRREKYQDILLVKGTPSPGSTTVSFAASDVDLVSVAEHLRSAGADVAGPAPTPWFSTDLTFTDTDGNTVTLTAPRTAEKDAAQEWVHDRVTGDFELVPETRHGAE
ncbi:VOC family protein [Falsarthrobacter nasiphocae]|uniref:Enzyme related to lactoylglutathione lyase n=1 Tax=Falsarthrobacter nasiphocae TaxID=189863 RepID=A0AAE3YHI1_9MICC|nr:VOC family protein [Falsarthrobacter nasiphocae]MDR6892392.1 putative enzyme related to lactoylglutathione lyase [Falsarthrobacter nasiphocae]